MHQNRFSHVSENRLLAEYAGLVMSQATLVLPHAANG